MLIDRRQLRCRAGFTIIEVLAALSIFGVIAVFLAPIFSSHFRHNTRSELRSGAVAAAQQILDEYRQQMISSLPTGGSEDRNVTVGGRQFAATVTFCTRAEYCALSSTRHIKVQVKQNTDQLYEVETVYTELR